MKNTAPSSLARRAAFTLIEMIGVLAIMAILAATITPNALRTIDRATVRSEVQTLHGLGDQVKVFLKTNGWPPGLNPNIALRLSWDQDLWKFADISSADLLTNRRQMARSYIYEPGASPRRVLILSSMRTGLALPTAANLNTTLLFDNVWNTIDGSLPTAAGPSWAGWAAWRNTLGGTTGDYLVIERVNLAPIYNTELQNLTVILINKGTTTVSYNIGGVGWTNILKGDPPVNVPCRPKDQINLFRAGGGATLDYSYVVPTGSSGRTFDFTDANKWVPQP